MAKMYYRASSMGNLMTEGRSKSELLGETCKKELAKTYAFNRYGITKPIKSKYLEKGNLNEEIGIDYLTKKTKRLFKKNEERIRNEETQLTGLPDLYEGESIECAEIIIDIKNSWDYLTFLEAKTEKLPKDRVWQAHTYMALTGAQRCDFTIVCTNAPVKMVADEKRKAFFELGIDDEEDDRYIAKCLEIERNMIFDMDEFLKEYPFAELVTLRMGIRKDFVNIPWDERIITVSVERDEAAINSIYERVPYWNAYIENTFMNGKS